jgi:hypothetical protein
MASLTKVCSNLSKMMMRGESECFGLGTTSSICKSACKSTPRFADVENDVLECEVSHHVREGATMGLRLPLLL